MKAIIRTEYGSPDVLRLEDVPIPVPKDDEVLIRVHAASVNALDWRLLRGKPAVARFIVGGMLRPKHRMLGADVAGRIEAVGDHVNAFRPGDEVFGGVGTGAFAEYVCATADRIVPKPSNVSFEQAAAVPVAGLTALQGLRDKGGVRPGQRVAIDGASGGVGTFAVQIAKAFGAEVTAVCSTKAIGIAQSIGADHVVDYTQDDFTRRGPLYDLIFAANAHRSIFDYRRALKPGGVYVMGGGGGVQILQAMVLGPLLSRIGSRKMGILMVKRTKQDFAVLGDLLGTGRIVPVIDRHYRLSETAEAIRYVEQGHAKGKVVVIVEA